jgi:hypothetical protein
MSSEEKVESDPEFYSPKKYPEHWHYEPTHFQRTQNIKEFVRSMPIDKTISGFNVRNPCFGLDHELPSLDNDIPDEEVAKGYKKGGPKEARLFRVALLGAKKEIDHLFPVKVQGLPPMIKEEELKEYFAPFGEIGDIYCPRDGETRKLVAPFAIIRYESKSSADKCIFESSLVMKKLIFYPNDVFRIQMSPLSKQESIFGQNSGVHGITNEITDTMRETQIMIDNKKEDVTQCITLDECFSRNGYPWGSKAELKILEEHAPIEVLQYYNILITNLHVMSSTEKIRQAFEDLGDVIVGDLYCPMELVITRRPTDGRKNEGFGFIRFKDLRDQRKCMKAIKKGLIIIDDHVIDGELVPPYSWPTDKTRRYF